MYSLALQGVMKWLNGLAFPMLVLRQINLWTKKKEEKHYQ